MDYMDVITSTPAGMKRLNLNKIVRVITPETTDFGLEGRIVQVKINVNHHVCYRVEWFDGTVSEFSHGSNGIKIL